MWLLYLQYEPELFPGLIYRMLVPKVVLLIFVSGKVVLTGSNDVPYCPCLSCTQVVCLLLLAWTLPLSVQAWSKLYGTGARRCKGEAADL